MHALHMTPEDIKRHPWIGVLIGLVGLGLFTYLGYDAARELRDLSGQRSPELVSIGELKGVQPIQSRWVTVTGYRLDCAMVEQMRRSDPIERWVSGPVYSTYVVMTDLSGEQIAVAHMSGDVTCPGFGDKPLTGILASTHASDEFVFASMALSKKTSASLILHVGTGPENSRVILPIGIILGLTCLALTLYSSRLWLAKWESRSA